MDLGQGQGQETAYLIDYFALTRSWTSVSNRWDEAYVECRIYLSMHPVSQHTRILLGLEPTRHQVLMVVPQRLKLAYLSRYDDRIQEHGMT